MQKVRYGFSSQEIGKIWHRFLVNYIFIWPIKIAKAWNRSPATFKVRINITYLIHSCTFPSNFVSSTKSNKQIYPKDIWNQLS